MPHGVRAHWRRTRATARSWVVPLPFSVGCSGRIRGVMFPAAGIMSAVQMQSMSRLPMATSSSRRDLEAVVERGHRHLGLARLRPMVPRLAWVAHQREAVSRARTKGYSPRACWFSGSRPTPDQVAHRCSFSGSGHSCGTPKPLGIARPEVSLNAGVVDGSGADPGLRLVPQEPLPPVVLREEACESVASFA
jgi:hypothetical protein